MKKRRRVEQVVVTKAARSRPSMQGPVSGVPPPGVDSEPPRPKTKTSRPRKNCGGPQEDVVLRQTSLLEAMKTCTASVPADAAPRTPYVYPALRPVLPKPEQKRAKVLYHEQMESPAAVKALEQLGLPTSAAQKRYVQFMWLHLSERGKSDLLRRAKVDAAKAKGSDGGERQGVNAGGEMSVSDAP
jgi:hypothetical protein